MPKSKLPGEGFLPLDASVAKFLAQGQDRQTTARLPKAQRKAKAKEHQHNDERRGQRATYDLPPEIIDHIKKLADQHKTSASQITALAMALFIDRIDNDPEFLQGYLVLLDKPGPRFERKVILPNKGEK
jgi:hypothetical protein